MHHAASALVTWCSNVNRTVGHTHHRLASGRPESADGFNGNEQGLYRKTKEKKRSVPSKRWNVGRRPPPPPPYSSPFFFFLLAPACGVYVCWRTFGNRERDCKTCQGSYATLSDCFVGGRSIATTPGFLNLGANFSCKQRQHRFFYSRIPRPRKLNEQWVIISQFVGNLPSSFEKAHSFD